MDIEKEITEYHTFESYNSKVLQLCKIATGKSDDCWYAGEDDERQEWKEIYDKLFNLQKRMKA